MKLIPKLASVILITLLLYSCENKATTPAVTTSAVSNVTTTTAVSGGTVTDDGGAAITVNGVCWNISDKPTIENNKSVGSTTSGSHLPVIYRTLHQSLRITLEHMPQTVPEPVMESQ